VKSRADIHLRLKVWLSLGRPSRHF